MSVATLSADFLTRVETRLNNSSLFGKMAAWMEENVVLNGKPFSFKDHEFQIQIAGETRSMVVKKPSQVGLSVISIQKALGFTALSRGKHLIYVLPTAVFSTTFAKSRIDPIIDESPRIKEKVNAAVSSSKLKKIGTCFLHMGGAQSISQVISTPAEAITVDEFDFCDPDTVTAYESRLGHAENGGITSKFSTPTLPDFGVSKEIKSSTWARYLVKCAHCYAEVAPIFSEHVRIPGFDKSFDEFDRDVLESGQCKIDLAYIACPRCGGSLDKALADKSARRWVEQFPSRTVAGYDVRPFDLYKYNPTSRVLAKIAKYKTKQNYYNFALGESYLSAESQIMAGTVDANTKLSLLDTNGIGQMCMGVDVGASLCHVMIGTRRNNLILVRRCLRIFASDGNMKDQILKLAAEEKIISLVIDAGPEYNLSRDICDGVRALYAFPAYYTEKGEQNLDYFRINEKEKHLLINRNKACQEWVEKVNHSKVQWTQSEEMSLVREHLPQMKRVQDMGEDGNTDEMSYHWVKASTQDHYFHSGLYLKAAIDVANAQAGSKLPAAPLLISSVKVGGGDAGSQPNVMSRLRSRVTGLR